MKGISPLIASVLLIAFTVAVAGILSVWLSTFTKTSTETVEEQAETELICSYGGISLSNLKFNTSTKYMTGNIENTRTISLGEITLQIIYENKSMQKNRLCLSGTTAINCTTANISLVPREKIGFNVSASSNYETIRVMSNCSNVYDEASSGEVSRS